MKTLLLILLLSPIFVYSQTEATILLRGNDTEYKVTILERSDEEIKVKTDKGVEVTILMENVVSIVDGHIEEENDGCKYLKNEVDDMTGEKIIITESKSLSKVPGIGNLSASAGYSDQNGKAVIFFLNFYDAFSISAGNKILVKVSSGEVHQLLNPNYVLAEVGTYPPRYNASIVINLDESFEELFRTTSILKIRVYTDNGYRDFEVEEKNQMKIAKVLNCIQ